VCTQLALPLDAALEAPLLAEVGAKLSGFVPQVCPLTSARSKALLHQQAKNNLY